MKLSIVVHCKKKQTCLGRTCRLQASPCCLKCICESISSILFMGIFHPSLICSPFSVLVIPMHDAKTSRFSKLSVQAAHHQSLISRRNLILQNLEHGKHRKILQTCDNLSLKRSTAADFIAVESCFFRRLPVFDLQYYIPELRSARGEDMSSHQNSSIRSAAQGLATTIRKWYLSPHGH